MNWIDSIREVRRAQENNRLVLFVGSGVSANSKIPKWSDLVKKFADKIGYTPSCLSAGIVQSRPIISFTSDELIKIPEYYFLSDDSKEHSEYYNLITETLRGGNPNSIDDEIFKVLPHHIITTNYDPLLENSTAVNAQLYKVIRQDSDLLSVASDRYIIKMHGDLEYPNTIVLKESDYINYEQEHTLMCTFIKSLLINHTFVFIGYSLNDYNLNIIIGWINYFRKIYGNPEGPKNFLIQGYVSSKHDVTRLQNRNIMTIALDSLPNDIVDNCIVPDDLECESGKKLYAYLKCITEQKLFNKYMPLENILIEKYKTLEGYRKISFEDIIRVNRLGRTEFFGSILCFYEEHWYTQIAELINSNKLISNTFGKSGIEVICLHNSRLSQRITYSSLDDLFVMYLDNDYISLVKKLNSDSTIDAKIYYYRLLNIMPNEIDDILDAASKKVSKEDYVSLILHKMRNRLASAAKNPEAKISELNAIFDTLPHRYRNSVNFLKKMHQSDATNHAKMEVLLKNQEERYDYSNTTSYSSDCFENLQLLQAYAYDYYYFVKLNYLPIEYYSNSKTYLGYYLQAIFCSYSPVSRTKPKGILNFDTPCRPYILNEVDIDMIVKYTYYKSIKQWIKKYAVQEILIESDINIPRKFSNFCKSVVHFANADLMSQLKCFVSVILMLQLTEEEKTTIFSATVEMAEDVIRQFPNSIENFIEPILELVSSVRVEGCNRQKEIFINSILKPSVIRQVCARHRYELEAVLKKYCDYTTEETREHLIKEIDGTESIIKKCKLIFALRNIIPIERYVSYLTEHIVDIDAYSIFDMVIGRVLPFDSSIMERMIKLVETHYRERIANQGTISYPDQLSSAIECCILLKLFGFPVDLSMLKPYVQYSEHLGFMLDPDNFDYSQVDLNNYMWENLFYSEYKEYFIKRKNSILTEDLESVFARGVASMDMQKMVFGLLLDDTELQRFGKQSREIV